MSTTLYVLNFSLVFRSVHGSTCLWRACQLLEALCSLLPASFSSAHFGLFHTCGHSQGWASQQAGACFLGHGSPTPPRPIVRLMFRIAQRLQAHVLEVLRCIFFCVVVRRGIA